jgi:site-specific DNA recombinase
MSATTTPTKAAIYLRQSLDATGERLAVDRQREDCQAIAAARGWTVIGEYVDNSISASKKTKRRPEYDRMVDDFTAGRFTALVCYDLDRLTRQPRQLEDWIDAAEERGLLLVTANGEADLSTDGGRLFARIKASVARAEVERKSARQVRAAQQRADRGRPPSGVRLTGYTTAGDVIEGEALDVHELFDRFIEGDSLRALAAWLTARQVPTRRGGAWSPSSVRTMLTNPRYAGRAVYRGEETGKAGAWAPIVTDDVFAIAQGVLNDPRRRTHRGTDRRHLGSGLYVCGRCGDRVRAWSGDRYRCANACFTRSQAPIDALVLAVVRAVLARPGLAESLHPATDVDGLRLAGEVKALRERLARIEADYDEGVIDGRRYTVAAGKVRAQLQQVETTQGQRAAGRRGASVLAAVAPVAEFDAAPLMIRRAVIDALCTVRLHPAPHGRKTFDPESVTIEWKGGV